MANNMVLTYLHQLDPESFGTVVSQRRPKFIMGPLDVSLEYPLSKSRVITQILIVVNGD